jgi:hypothetical protein
MRDLILTNDLDGVHFVAPFPIMTALSLARGRFSLPDPDHPLGEYQPARSFVRKTRDRLWRFTIRIRPMRRESLQALEAFRSIARDRQRKLRMVALTGRVKDQHAVTRERLEAGGYLDYFDDLYLNEGRSTTIWKERTVRELLATGANVVHLEDDLRAALAVARSQPANGDQQVLVYLVRNPSNRNRLLKRAGIDLPDNVYPVRSLLDAATDFRLRLDDGRL